MADVTANAKIIAREGTAEKVVIYRVTQVDTGDTIDVSSEFSLVKDAVTVCTGDGPAGDVAADASLVVTLDIAAAADETFYVMVIGNAA